MVDQGRGNFASGLAGHWVLPANGAFVSWDLFLNVFGDHDEAVGIADDNAFAFV